MDFLQSALYEPTASIEFVDVDIEVNYYCHHQVHIEKKKLEKNDCAAETSHGRRTSVDTLFDDLDAALLKMQCSTVELLPRKSEKKVKKSASKKVKNFCRAIFRSNDIEHVRLIEEPLSKDYDDLQSSAAHKLHRKLFNKDWTTTRKKVKKFFLQSFLYMGHGVSSINPVFMVPSTISARYSCMQQRYTEPSFYP